MADTKRKKTEHSINLECESNQIKSKRTTNQQEFQLKAKTRKILGVFTVLLITSCGSMPLGSMLKVASLNENDLLNIRPEQVRTRITLSEPAQLKTRDVRLVLQFEFKGETKREYQFLLNLLNERRVEENCLFCSVESRNLYEFKLSDESISEFKKYQREFLKYGRPEQYQWTVYYYLKHKPKANEEIDLDLELKFADTQDYFYLLKGASVEVNSSSN